jgi:hypothetical protein
MIEEDWQIQFIDFIKEFKLPPHVDAKRAEAAHIIRQSMGFVLVGTICISALLQASLRNVLPLKKGKTSSERYMKESVTTTPYQGR